MISPITGEPVGGLLSEEERTTGLARYKEILGDLGSELVQWVKNPRSSDAALSPLTGDRMDERRPDEAQTKGLARLSEMARDLSSEVRRWIKDPHAPDLTRSPLTGAPRADLFAVESESKRALGSLGGVFTVYFAVGLIYVILLVTLRWMPEAPNHPIEVNLPNLVFLVEPGPGGGGGGGGSESPEPVSALKIEGEDLAKQAIDIENEDALVFEELVEEKEEEPPVEEEEEPREIKAPIVEQSPDDMDQIGEIDSPERLVASAGPGSGPGMGEGEGPGIGPGYGGGFGGGAYRLGTGVVPPTLQRQVRPSYTDEALARKIQGSVELEVVILSNGKVGPIRIIRSLDRGLDLKAIEAVRQWRFKPGLFQSKPVDVLAVITVDFTLL
jgi:protein TonB